MADEIAATPDAAGTIRKPGIDWSDPALPAGDAPPMPRWRLPCSAALYVLWVGFLAVMVVVRLRTTPF